MNVADKLMSVRSGIPAGCKLIAVTKTHPVETILKAYEAGHRIFGENKVQEMMPKYEALPKDIEWHLIGHLQTNKVKYIAPFISLIHSVDSLRLLEEINKQGERINRQIQCLLQVHIATEETKFGLSPDELTQLVSSAAMAALDHVRVTGLMGMASLTVDQARVRAEFRGLKQLFDSIRNMDLPAHVVMSELSMGMSGDYKIAIGEGSTMVRVGSAIFGERHSTKTI